MTIPMLRGCPWQYGLVGALTVAVCAAFLLGQPGDLPLDDAYIHLQYADNLAREHRLVFNPGEFTGIGATSILWVLILAAFKMMGAPTLVAAKAMGMAAFVVAAWCVYDLSGSIHARLLGERGEFAPLCTTVLFVLSGNMVWFALSGMETMLFLALGLLALVYYQSSRFGAMSVCLALMMLTRTEGIVLGALILAVQVARTQRVGRGPQSAPVRRWLRRRFPAHADAWFGTVANGGEASRKRARAAAAASRWRLLLACLVFAAVVTPWFAFVYHTTGHALPTSFSGKKLSQMAGLDHFLRSRPYLAPLVHLKPLVFVGLWVGYLILYVFGGAFFPGPSLPVGRLAGLPAIVRVSVAALVVVAAVLVPLLVRGAAAVKHWWLSALRSGQEDRTILVLFLWTLLHNVAYMILFPSMGTTTRYQALNHLVVWLLVALGVFSLRRRRWLFAGALVVVTVTAGADLCYWRTVYAANMDHMHNVRIASSLFLDRELPRDAVIAAHDIGAVRYYGRRRVVDLGGLTDAGFVAVEKRHEVDKYLLDHHVSYLVIPGKHSTETKPLYDFLGFLGLRNSSLLTLRERWSFENDYRVWARGMKPTGNYLPSVKVYEVVPKR